MKLIRVGMTVMLIGLVGCAHRTMRGTVAMKATDQEAHVCLGDNEVKPGDKVTFFNNVCTGGKAKAELRELACEMKPLGGGEVIKTLNQHYSIVKVDPGVQFGEGTLVEKN